VAEVSSVKQALAQSQVLEQVQEAARRQGEQQQQSFAVSLNRQVDTREHQVNQGEEPRPETLDPDARQEREGSKDSKSSPDGPRKDEGEDEDEDELGRHIDVHA
jgi:hypothetical protein